ncbi:MAG: hypothetical protein ACPLRY_01830 [Candidatus Bathyarchaeales archaeon]
MKRRKRIRAHGITMLLTVIVHSTTILGVMIPSFSSGLTPYILENFAKPISLISFFHGITGLLAWLLGIWIVVVWHLSPSTQACYRKKSAMRITLVLWLIALILGFVMYLNFYTAILPM